MTDSCIGETPLYEGIREGGDKNWRNEILCYLQHKSQVKQEACGKPLRGILYIYNPCETVIIIIYILLDLQHRNQYIWAKVLLI